MSRLILLYLVVLFTWSCAFTVIAGNQNLMDIRDTFKSKFSKLSEISYKESRLRYENSKLYWEYQDQVNDYRLALLEEYGY